MTSQENSLGSAHDPILGLIEQKEPSPKSFGFLLAFVLLSVPIIYFYPVPHLFLFRPLSVISIISASVALFLAYKNPSIYIIPNRWWHKFALFLSVIVSPVVIWILFYLFITPASFLYRIFGVKFVQNHYKQNLGSYWIIREQSSTDPKDQLKKQY